MAERRKFTRGERAAQPDPIRDIAYGDPEQPERDIGGEFLVQARKPKMCCGIELPVTGRCDYCD
ncbi:MAG: hypothetical protein ACKOI2_11670 [Actinomycetota bacterium]